MKTTQNRCNQNKDIFTIGTFSTQFRKSVFLISFRQVFFQKVKFKFEQTSLFKRVRFNMICLEMNQ